MLNFPNHYLPDILIKEHETALALAANQATSSTSSMTGSTSASASGVVPLSALQPTQRTIVDDLQLRFDLQRKKPTASVFTPPDNIKYWEENQGNKEITDYDEEAEFTEKDNVFPIQKALECWAFLNIYHKVLKLDTFTFDDFIYAIGWNSDQFNDIGNCELLDEMFCAVLGGIISNEVPSKKVSTTTSADGEVTISGLLITLPPKNIFQGKQPDQGDDDEDRGSDTENENEDNLLDKSDNESDSEKEKEKEMVKENEKENDNEKGKEDDENDDDNDDEDADADAEDEDELDAKDGDDDGEEFYGHNAYNVINYRNTPWYDRLRKRNFKDGNWQCIMMGVFSMVEYVPAFKSIIDIVYKTLAPIDESSRGNNNTTPTMVLNKFYEELNPSLRIQCLNLLITLLSGGKLVRSYIDECLDISTGLRRDRLDNIRDYKVCLEIIHQLNTQVQNKIDEVRKEKLEEKDKVKEEKDEKKEDDIVMDDGEVKKEEADEIAAEEKVEEEVEEGKIVDDMEVDSAGTTDMNTEQKPSIVSDSNGTKTKSEPEVTEPKRRTFVRINFNALEMTEEEREISLKDENFKQTWEKKREELIRIAELKRTKKDIELKLIEMDCQRVKLLGKDRFGNKYWWFENNGLPTLHGGSSGDDNDDDDEKDKENNDDDDIQKDDLLDETYLMGKLWIQGPSKEDVVGFLKSNEEEIQKIKSTFKNNENAKKSKKRATDEDYIKTQEDIDGFYEEVEKSQDYKEMDFSKYPPSFTKTVEELYGIKYLRKQIIDTKQVVEGEPEKALIFDRFGAIPKNDNWKFLTPIQRKLIEEASSPLLDNTEWRYYDKREDLDNLLSWMNPWGSRESLLRKELLVVKDAIYQSIDARRKALWLDRVPEKELEIEKQLSEIEEKLKADTAACKREKKKAAENKEKEGVQESVLEGGEEEVAEEESEVDSDDLDEVVVLPRGKRRAAAVAAETSMTMRKRQKASNTTTVSPPPVVLTPEQTIASGSVEDLENLQTELKEKLKETKKGRELARILEWVNLGAREELDRSLYEGGDKLKPRSKRQQPKR